MSYESYQALLKERELLDERVKGLDEAISAAYNRLFTVSFAVRSVGLFDYVSEECTSDPLSAVVWAHTPDAAREYLLDADISALDAVGTAENELEDLLEPDIQDVLELAIEEGDLEEGDPIPEIEFTHEVSIISVVDDGLADGVQHADGELEITELTTT